MHTLMSELNQMRVAGNTLTKEEQKQLLEAILPACQPQEGTPQNTFTPSELEQLKKAISNLEIGPRSTEAKKSNNTLDIQSWFAPAQQDGSSEASPQDGDCSYDNVEEEDALDWYGAPRFHPQSHLAKKFRETVRSGAFTTPTNGVCPGFLQCNLVVLPQGQVAFDFLLFCQRNPKACPLIDVCDVGSPFCPGVAPGADLRTDVPKYAIYRDGKLDKEVTDVTDDWPEQSVAFLIGCSFSYDGALMKAGIPLKSAEQGKNVPMYKTNLKCRPSGCLRGNMVLSMKPIPATQVATHIEITNKYKHAHGGPVTVSSAESIGISDMGKPEWGDSIDVSADEVPIFHACGVTPQAILMESKVPFAITHAAGHMFVTDLPSDLGV